MRLTVPSSVLEIPYEQRIVFGNMSSAVFYKTTEWKRARYLALRTLGNKCQLCGAGAKDAPLHVDHIKARFLCPELCFDLHNLQVLCQDCHTAKDLQEANDFRGDFTRYQPTKVRDVLRLKPFHLVLDHRFPTCSREASIFAEDVDCTVKSYHSRWRLLVRFLHGYRFTYPQAVSLSVGDFLRIPQMKHGRYRRLTASKDASDPLFDVARIPFPGNISDLVVRG